MKKEGVNRKHQHDVNAEHQSSGYVKDESILGFIDFDRNLVPLENKLYIQKFSDGLYKVSKAR